MKESIIKMHSKISSWLSNLYNIDTESNDLLCEKWNKEDAIKRKNNFMNELRNNHMVSITNLEWVEKELDKRIIEQETERLNKM